MDPRPQASRRSNKAILMERFGFDCGKHCTNKVVQEHEAAAAKKVADEKHAKLVSGSHDEAAVKQFLFEQGLIHAEMLIGPGKTGKAKMGKPCEIERFSFPVHAGVIFLPGEPVSQQLEPFAQLLFRHLVISIHDAFQVKLVPEIGDLLLDAVKPGVDASIGHVNLRCQFSC
jgi:hypothetical protein